MDFNKLNNYGPFILRVGIALVFLWFGSQQLLHSVEWTGWLPSWTQNLPVSRTTFVFMNGIFEVIFGTLLFLGLFTRLSSLLLGLHLLAIAFTIGYNDVGVRDFGLAIATLSIFFYGSSKWPAGRKLKNNNNNSHKS
jgi:uncharacterized membrane protein YphA (DoxX/SURF4 family)